MDYLDLNATQGNDSIQIRGRIRSSTPILAMIAYNDRENKGQRGYGVNKDYDATTWTPVVSLKMNSAFVSESLGRAIMRFA